MPPADLRKDRDHSSRLWQHRGLLGSLTLLIVLSLGALELYRPDAQKDAAVSPSKFSGARAVETLSQLVGDTVANPMGSVANAVVRERIVSCLKALGYTPEIQSGVVVCNRYGTCGMPKTFGLPAAGLTLQRARAPQATAIHEGDAAIAVANFRLPRLPVTAVRYNTGEGLRR